MATRINGYCAEPGCSVRVKDGRCRKHDRIAGRQLQRLRMTLFEQQPFCAMCGERVATIRDHIHPFALGGSEDAQNTQALCTHCHDLKTFRR